MKIMYVIDAGPVNGGAPISTSILAISLRVMIMRLLWSCLKIKILRFWIKE